MNERVSKEHNEQPAVNPELQLLFTNYHKLEADNKAINESKREIRNIAKEKHGVLKSVFAHEIRMQKLDPDVRQQFEIACKDIKVAIGIEDLLNTEYDPNQDPIEAGKKQKARDLKVA